MLAQNFKSAEELEISEAHRQALMKTLVLLETGKMQHTPPPKIPSKQENPKFTGHFNMLVWACEHSCGTIACIGGTAEIVGNVRFHGMPKNYNLVDLFSPVNVKDWDRITPAQAAMALRSYLTVGSPRWDLAITNAD